jgi:hypothetical protein
MLRWLGHVERMDETKLTKEIYEADVGGMLERNKNGEILEKGQIKSIRYRRACMRNLMTMEEAKGVCKDRSKWEEEISAYPKGKRA